MGPKKKNFASVHFPLTPGAVELADLSKFRGIMFDIRGDGNSEYRMRFDSYRVRRGESFHAVIPASPEWQRQEIPFPSLTRSGGTPADWQGDDIRDLSIEVSGPALSRQWLEIDNIHFYR